MKRLTCSKEWFDEESAERYVLEQSQESLFLTEKGNWVLLDGYGSYAKIDANRAVFLLLENGLHEVAESYCEDDDDVDLDELIRNHFSDLEV